MTFIGSVSTQFSCNLRQSSDIADEADNSVVADGVIGTSAKKEIVDIAAQVPVTDKKKTMRGSAESKKVDTTKSRSGGGKSFALIVQRPQHLSDMLLDYPVAPPLEAITELGGSPHRIAWGNISNGNSVREKVGKGVLLSGYFSLPIMNADSRSVSVRFEVDGRQHMLHNFSVRVVQPSFKKSSDSTGYCSTTDKPFEVDSEFGAKSGHREGRRTTGERMSREAPLYDPMAGNVGVLDDDTLNIPSGQSTLVPLELFVSGVSDGDIFIVCKKRSDGKLFGALTLSVIPFGSSKLTVPLNFRCRRLDESFAFSFLTEEHSVADAVAVAPILTLPDFNRDQGSAPERLSSRNQKPSEKVSTSIRDPSEIVSVRGKGVSPRGSGGSRAQRDATNRASDVAKRYEALRSADSAQFSSSTAARHLAEREGSSAFDSLRSTEAEIVEKKSDNSKEIESNTALDMDASKVKSQFYVHKMYSGKDGESSVSNFFQYACNPTVAYALDDNQTNAIFPLLITLHGTASTPTDQVDAMISCISHFI